MYIAFLFVIYEDIISIKPLEIYTIKMHVIYPTAQTFQFYHSYNS